MPNLFYYNAKVIRWVDGDTLDIELDLGFKISMTKRIRLLGINAPEIKTASGKKVKTFCEEYLPAGKEFIFKSYRDKKGGYGRLLGTIFKQGSTKSLNELLLESKMALRYRTPSMRRLKEEFIYTC
jgi:micrococcal nuclease